MSGEQKGEVFNATLRGRVDADHVMLSSVMQANGYQVPFNFTGVMSGATMSGTVRMGEYGAATFMAAKT